MSQIIPQKQEREQSVPSWINPQELQKVSAPELKVGLVKTASESSFATVTVSHGCTNCGKTYNRDSADIQSQINIAQRKASIEGKPLSTVALHCPSCGGSLATYSRTAISKSNPDVRQGDNFVSASRGAVNTVLDRHLTYKAAQALENFAVKQGMSMARARILRSTRDAVAGADVPLTNSVECEIEWTLAPRLKTRIFATISIDSAGNYEFPKVFKTSDHKEYPFDEKTIASIEKNADMFKTPPSPKLRQTDVPQYRKSDPTRFRASSLKDGMSANDVIHEAYKTIQSSMKLSQADNVHLANFVSLSKNATSKDELVALAKGIFGEANDGVAGVIFGHLDLIQESDDAQLVSSLLKEATEDTTCKCGKDDCEKCKKNASEDEKSHPFEKKA